MQNDDSTYEGSSNAKYEIPKKGFFLGDKDDSL